MKTTARRLLTSAAMAMTAVLAFGPAADAATVAYTAHFQCQASSPIGPQTTTLDQDASVTAPDTVAAGGALTVVVDPAVNTVPSSVNGFTVQNVRNLRLKVPVPANSTYVGATFSGGSSNLGAVTISQSGGIVTLTVPGPLTGGGTFELPVVTVSLTAGAAGNTITSSLYGTSYANPGLQFVARVQSFFAFDSNVACYPSPNPVITTTQIV